MLGAVRPFVNCLDPLYTSSGRAKVESEVDCLGYNIKVCPLRDVLREPCFDVGNNLIRACGIGRDNVTFFGFELHVRDGLGKVEHYKKLLQMC